MQRECGEGRRNENNEQHVGYFCCNDFFFLSLIYNAIILSSPSPKSKVPKSRPKGLGLPLKSNVQKIYQSTLTFRRRVARYVRNDAFWSGPWDFRLWDFGLRLDNCRYKIFEHFVCISTFIFNI